MKNKILFILFLCLCLSPITAKARIVCSVDETLRLKKIASNLSTSYDYNEVFNNGDKYGSVTFILKFTNMHNDIRIVDKSNEQTYYNNSENEVIITGKTPGKSYAFEIYGAYGDCNHTFLINLYVTTPSYNIYYVDPICEKIPSSSICSKWNNLSMSYDEFKAKAESQIVKEEEIIDDSKTHQSITRFEKIISFLADWSLLIFIPIILISLILIIYLTNKDNFDLKV